VREFFLQPNFFWQWIFTHFTVLDDGLLCACSVYPPLKRLVCQRLGSSTSTLGRTFGVVQFTDLAHVRAKNTSHKQASPLSLCGCASVTSTTTTTTRERTNAASSLERLPEEERGEERSRLRLRGGDRRGGGGGGGERRALTSVQHSLLVTFYRRERLSLSLGGAFYSCEITASARRQ